MNGRMASPCCSTPSTLRRPRESWKNGGTSAGKMMCLLKSVGFSNGFQIANSSDLAKDSSGTDRTQQPTASHFFGTPFKQSQLDPAKCLHFEL